MQGKLVPWSVVWPWWRAKYLKRPEGEKVVTKPPDRLVHQVHEAIKRAGTNGLTDVDADRLFGCQLAGAQRTQVFYILKGRGLIVSERTAGGGTLWKSRTQGNRASDDEQPKVYRHGRYEPADQPLRSWQCTTWPSLSIGKSIHFKNGHFCTRDPELARLIENAHGYGSQILEDPVGVENYEPDRPACVAIH